MNWTLMDDPTNKENKNAGNGGDLVKHTVYLAVLRFLAAREPWSRGLRVRECHAGRGIYHIPDGDSRRRLVSCLHADTASKDGPILLRDAQRNVLGALAESRELLGDSQWYAGSALINALTLADSGPRLHTLDLYEWQPETRQILRSVLADMRSKGVLSINVLPNPDLGKEFDGEAYIAQTVATWNKEDLVLLDPFAMWRTSSDRSKRSRYGAIVDALLRLGSEAPSLVLFWTWGNAFPVADGDLDGSSRPVKNGYQDLRSRLHEAGFHFALVKWRWGLQFAMWVVVPTELLTELRDEIDTHCRLLSRHLVWSGCGHSLSHPLVDVSVD